MKECLDIFESCYTQEGDHLITDTYVPAPGTYLLVNTKDFGQYEKDFAFSMMTDVQSD